MRLPDTNVLLYAVNLDAPQQAAAQTWLAEGFDSTVGVALTWVALLGFIRIATRPGIFATPLEVETALKVVDRWISHPGARIVQPGERHASLLGRLLVGAGAAGNLTNDAHLAALAIEHGATLGSFDRDYRRFAGLQFDLLRA